MIIFEYSNNYRQLFSFGNYSKNFEATNIFGYSFVKEKLHLIQVERFVSDVELFVSGFKLFVSDVELFVSGFGLFVSDVEWLVSDIELFVSGVELFV